MNKSSRIRTAIVMAVICVALAGAAVFFVLGANSKKASAKTSEQAGAELQTRFTEKNAQVQALKEEVSALETQLSGQAQAEEPEGDDPLAQLKEDMADFKGQQSEVTESAAEESAEDSAEASIDNLAVGAIVSPGIIDPFHLDSFFKAYEITVGDAVYNRISGKSYRENDNVALSDLRYLKLLHYNFDGKIQVGELIVNAQRVEEFRQAFLRLYENQYPIQSMYLVDNYWTGDPDSTDTASIDVNNTSAFCYRTATGSGNLSNHAYGCAIDINPQQNPYVTYNSDGSANYAHSNAAPYLDRTSGLPHVITHEDLCYQVFAELGFSWGGDWSSPKDYQHFEKAL